MEQEQIITRVPGITPSTPTPEHIKSSLAGLQGLRFRIGDPQNEKRTIGTV